MIFSWLVCYSPSQTLRYSVEYDAALVLNTEFGYKEPEGKPFYQRLLWDTI